MNCASIIPGGAAKKACLLDQPTNLIFLEEGIKFDNYLDIVNTETWRALIQETLKVYPTLAIRGVAVTKPAVVKETNGNGSQTSTRLDAGMVVANLQTTAGDFKEMIQAMKGNNYGVIIGLGIDKILVKENLDGTLEGFTGQCTAVPFGMPGMDAKVEEFQVDINWQDANEWDQYRIIQLPIYLKELVEMVPEGLDLQVNTPLDDETMLVKVTKRGTGVVVTDTLTSDFIEKSLSAITCTPAASGGLYDLSIDKGTGVPLVKGDYAWARLVKKTANVFEMISNKFLIRVW